MNRVCYHFTWKTSRQRPLAAGAVKQAERHFRKTAKRMGWTIWGLELTGPDVMLVVETDSHHSPHQVQFRFKQESARIRKQFKALAGLPGLWTRQYAVQSLSIFGGDSANR